ncbi:MAG: 30S ribosomal protein S3 [archaeon]|nr:30S ribosomal protein S3 [archaeon]
MIERTFVQQGVKLLELENFLRSELNKAGFTKTEIIKTPLVTRIVVNVTRPGIAIGKSGQNIKQLTDTIGTRFGVNNPQLEIREIEKPDLDAAAVGNRVKSLIERGYSWRSVVYRTVRDIQFAGAQGVELLLSGKLAGKAGRKRKQRISAGYMKKVGFQTTYVDFAKTAAYTKIGAIGIKVKIVKPETMFPDKFNLPLHLEALEKRTAAPAVVEAEPEQKTGETAKEEATEKVVEEKKEGEPAKEEAKKDGKKNETGVETKKEPDKHSKEKKKTEEKPLGKKEKVKVEKDE